MKKSILIIALLTLGLAFSSCQKLKYCQCYASVDGEDIALGEDLDVENMTEEQIEALTAKYKYNLYTMEHGTCNDKQNEIVGWGQVKCVEVDPKDPEGTWYERLFNKLFGGSHNNNSNNNNNNNNNNSGNTGKP